MATGIFKIFLLSLTFICVSCAQEPSEKVKVDVYYESLCPDSRAFFKEQLWPTYEQLESKINLEMIPYGNARVVGEHGDWSFTCQHGPDECYGNIVQTCAINLMNDTRSSLKFILCAFKYRSQAKIISQCEKSDDMQRKLQACAGGPLGKNLEFKMATKTDSLNPPQTFIPWITINGKGSQEINRQANNDFMQLLCNYLESDIPPVCEEHRRLKRDVYRRLVGL